MTHYFKTGNNISIEPSDALEVLEHLPAATYVVKKNEMTNKLYLQTTNNFELPKKVYGNPGERSTRIIETFKSRSKSTGVLLSGDKGSGKTLLSKFVAVQLIEQGIPVIVVNEPWCGPQFNDLIGNITQPAMVIFDEFDKVYDEDDQKLLLTLLDGTVETKKLFVLTTNSGHVDPHLINRPGRIYYRYHYEGLDESFVREYAADTLNDKSKIESLVSVTNAFNTMTFDMVQTIIEEMNRYNENAIDVMDHINVDLTQDSAKYAVHIMYDGQPIDNSYYPRILDVNPLFSDYYPDIDIYVSDDCMFKSKHRSMVSDIELGPKVKHQISRGGVITFFKEVEGKELLIILERQQRKQFNWKAF